MPGRDRLIEIAREATDRAKIMAQNIDVAARNPTGATVESVERCADYAHEAIDRAVDAARILVKEAAKPCS